MPPDAAADLPELSVSQFVALHNQVLEYTMPSVTIVGELSSFRISKNKWVYFDLKDEAASVKFFGTVYQLDGPLEDGMLLRVTGTPRVHPLFGFSITVTSLALAGEGTIRRAADLLQQKLTAEGLFDPARKRELPYPPERIGIIASKESAAYADFCKVLNARWGGVEIVVANVQVQGEPAPGQIVDAIGQFNQMAEPPEVLVLTRGGGSIEDLAAFSTESVVRAVAGSRIPTLVAIGHEVDLSLAELAADVRASTPSNAAELLVPDKKAVQLSLKQARQQLGSALTASLRHAENVLKQQRQELVQTAERALNRAKNALQLRQQLLGALSPQATLRRGYAIVRSEGDKVVRSVAGLSPGSRLSIELADGIVQSEVRLDPKETRRGN